MSDTHEILIVDDQPANLDILTKTLEGKGYQVVTVPNGEIALSVAPRALPDLILLDVMMPGIDGFEVCRQLKKAESTRDIPVIFVTAKHETQSIVEGLSAGGVDYIQKPFEKAEVLARVETHLKISRLTHQLQQKNEALEASNRNLRNEIGKRERAEDALQIADEELSMISQQDADRWGISGFVGQSQTIKQILSDIRQLQEVGTTSVLIIGESGTGKELIARAIHFGGIRSKGRFVPLNCSAIPGELVEATLFGHTKGAFTGASQSRAGYFERASGGTLFLDEIGDMPFDLQAKLLRVLEDGTFTPIGGSKKKADVRIVAATNADLKQKIASRTFREDLYYRLARFTVDLPPLRERKEDIPLLTDHFLKLFAAEMRREEATLSQSTLASLMDYHFPGNVRELKNIIEHALILSRHGVIEPEHLHLADAVQIHIEPVESFRPLENIEETVLERTETDDEKQILSYVRKHGNINNRQCRELLGIDKPRATYLLGKLLKYGLFVREGAQRWARYRLKS